MIAFLVAARDGTVPLKLITRKVISRIRWGGVLGVH